MPLRIRFTLCLFLLLPTAMPAAWAHGEPPPSLKGIKVPATPGLTGGSKPIIINQQYARLLGKALFWDASLGSDGMACASCHFHAGADSRIQNQLNPGQKSKQPSGQTFELTASSRAGGPNYMLTLDDFPFYQHADPSDKSSAVTFQTDDIAGSSGTYPGIFETSSPNAQDQCAQADDAIFHWNGKNTRRVTDRNAPSVINAAFNYRNFWDGRANNLFNGENPWGVRDPKAGAWVSNTRGIALKRNLMLANASLASQAVGPPTSDAEMSCKQRSFADIGRKMLSRYPLEQQSISADDSVLGRFVRPEGKGIRLTYEQLIRKTFAKRYWNGQADFGKAQDGQPYTMMQANFALYFGLAIMEYEKTLISNQSPFDTPLGRDPAYPDYKVPTGLDATQKRGLKIFLNAHCQNCHNGPAFTAAADPYLSRANSGSPVVVTRSAIDGSSNNLLRDIGFANTSVTPNDQDPGAGGNDPFGNPLSYTGQYIQSLANGSTDLVDPIPVFACDLEQPFMFDWQAEDLRSYAATFPPGKCAGYRSEEQVPTATAMQAQRALPGYGKAGDVTEGTFKIPSLRNVELTGPYMHNGGMKSLAEVVQFYNRAGNLTNPGHFATFVPPQGFSEQDQQDLVEFLKSLTDPRVRWERAPFDHPELAIPSGATADGISPIRSNLNNEAFLALPAIGKSGRNAGQGPLRSFEEILSRQ